MDAFFYGDCAVAIGNHLNDVLRATCYRQKGSTAKRGWNVSPKIDRTILEAKLKELHDGETKPSEIYSKHKKDLILWAKQSTGLME